MYDDVPWDERVGLAGIGYVLIWVHEASIKSIKAR